MQCKVKRDADGVWYARPYLGRTPEGKPIQPYRQFPTATTEAEAQELADAWAKNLTACGLVKSALLVDLLSDYATMRERNGASPNSIRSYRLFAKYAAKYLVTANARDLTVMDFNRFEQRLLIPKENGGQGLSRNSVLNVHQFLRGAYRFFVRAGICDANPLFDVDKPTFEKHEAMALDACDFGALDAKLKELLTPDIEDKRAYRRAMNAFAAWLALRTGIRVGEVCAVRPGEVYRAAKCLHVGGTVVEKKGVKPYRRDVTKGRKCRNVAITDGDLETIGAFLALRERVCGPMSAQAPIVTETGAFERPTTVSRAFSAIAGKIGMPKALTFHGLRHTHATWLLMHGVDLKTVSERLGHADEATTLRLYAHVLPGRDAYAASVFEQAASDAAADIREVLQ